MSIYSKRQDAIPNIADERQKTIVGRLVFASLVRLKSIWMMIWWVRPMSNQGFCLCSLGSQGLPESARCMGFAKRCWCVHIMRNGWGLLYERPLLLKWKFELGGCCFQLQSLLFFRSFSRMESMLGRANRVSRSQLNVDHAGSYHTSDAHISSDTNLKNGDGN